MAGIRLRGHPGEGSLGISLAFSVCGCSHVHVCACVYVYIVVCMCECVCVCVNARNGLGWVACDGVCELRRVRVHMGVPPPLPLYYPPSYVTPGPLA